MSMLFMFVVVLNVMRVQVLVHQVAMPVHVAVYQVILEKHFQVVHDLFRAVIHFYSVVLAEHHGPCADLLDYV